MWTIFKIFTETVTILFLFCFGFSATRHVGSLLHNQGWTCTPPTLEGEVLTTGPQGSFSIYVLFPPIPYRCGKKSFWIQYLSTFQKAKNLFILELHCPIQHLLAICSCLLTFWNMENLNWHVCTLNVKYKMDFKVLVWKKEYAISQFLYW